MRAIWYELLRPDETVVDHYRPVGDEVRRFVGDRGTAGIPMAYLSWMPPTSIGGVTLGLQALFGAERLIVNDAGRVQSVTSPQLLEALQIGEGTSIGLPPFLAQQLLRTIRGGAKVPDSLMVIGLGGGPVPPGLVSELEAASGRHVLTGYGCTEMCGAVTTTRFDDDASVRDATVGRPVPGVNVRLGTEGRLLVDSPARALGYRTRSASSPSRLTTAGLIPAIG